MMNSPKIKALASDESSTSLTTSGEHSVGIPMDPSITAVAKGQVEGAWSITALGGDWEPEGIFVLPEGEAMQVDKGSAIRVQSSDGWHHCEFPQPGVLHGPVVWTEAMAASEQELLHSPYVNPFVAFGSILMGASGSVGAYLLLVHHVPHILLAGILPVTTIVMAFIAVGAIVFLDPLAKRLSPRTIASVNQRVSKTLRMSRSVLHALGSTQSHLKLVAPERPQDSLDEAISESLDRYHAQRAKLTAKKIASSPMIEHTSAMLKEISQRIDADNEAMREDGLRQTYLDLIQRAEADLALALDKKDADEAEALVNDMTTLLRQMDRHS